MLALLRPKLACLLPLLCAPGALQANDSNWVIQVGSAAPSGGTSVWTGSNPGVAVAAMESYRVNAKDAVRLRLEYLEFSGNSNAPQDLALPGGEPMAVPVLSINQFRSVSYGAEYVLGLGSGGAYLLGGGGASYLIASRRGTLFLPETNPAAFHFTANKLSPYLCAGLGYQFNRDWGIELRGQWAALGAQTRNVDLTKAGYPKPARASIEGLKAAAVSLGITYTFN